MLEELKDAKYNDIEDMVYRMQLTFDEILDKPDRKHFARLANRYTFSRVYIKALILI